jgi:UDP-N-acetylenolpyruvoylglucosamine reductase
MPNVQHQEHQHKSSFFTSQNCHLDKTKYSKVHVSSTDFTFSYRQSLFPRLFFITPATLSNTARPIGNPQEMLAWSIHKKLLEQTRKKIIDRRRRRIIRSQQEKKFTFKAAIIQLGRTKNKKNERNMKKC